MRKLFRITLKILAALLLVIGVLLTWAYTHADELEQEAVKALEAGLLTDMNIQEIDLQVLRHFPDVSLACKEVFLTDTYGKGDTLLWAGEVSFQLSLLNILRGDYRFEEVTISDGGMHLHRDVKGRDNYHFWRTSTDTSSSVSTFAIERVELRNIHFRMFDEPAAVEIETNYLSADITGSITGDSLSFNTSLETPRAWVKVEDKAWVPGLHIQASLQADLGLDRSIYAFRELDIEINEMLLEGNARFDLLDEGVICSIDSEIDDADLASLKRILPPQVIQGLNAYDIEGLVSGRFSLNGMAGRGNVPAWRFDGRLDHGMMLHRAEEIRLSGIDSKFVVAGGGASKELLQLASFSASLEGGEIDVKGVLNDFTDPRVSADLSADLDLADLQAFLSLDTIGTIQGEVEARLSFAGKLPIKEVDGEQKIDAAMLRAARLNGVVEFDNILLDLQGLPRPMSEFDGYFELIGDHGVIKEAQLLMGETDLALKGELHNLLPWLLVEDEVLEIRASCHSDEFHLASFVTEASSGRAEEEENYTFSLPDDLRIRVEASFERMRFRDFTAAKVKGIASLSEQGVFFDPMSLETADGKLNMQVSITPNDVGFSLVANAGMAALDVQKLFVAFEDFGQAFITSEHVRGRCTATASFRAFINPKLQIDPASIRSNIDLRVDQGELIGLSSMLAISGYMRENKLIAPFVRADELESRMKHIRFETLENQIEVKDSKIYFPSMDIKSSALDITISGTHWFDQHIDYSVALYLRDILIQKNQTEFGEVEDDGLGNRFFLSMTGTTDDPAFGYDRVARKEQRKKERQEERENFRQLLKDELGIFKGEPDTTSAPKSEDKPSSTITVVWGEEEETINGREKTDSTEEKGKSRWRLRPDKDEEKPPLFDDDDDDF